MKQNNNIGFLVAKDSTRSSCTAHAHVLNMIIEACPTDVTGRIECATAFDVDYVLVSVEGGAQDATACPLMVDALGKALTEFRGPSAEGASTTSLKKQPNQTKKNPLLHRLFK